MISQPRGWVPDPQPGGGPPPLQVNVASLAMWPIDALTPHHVRRFEVAGAMLDVFACPEGSGCEEVTKKVPCHACKAMHSMK